MSIENNYQEEGFVAHKGRDFLIQNGYTIKSFNPPGSHGGITLTGSYRGRGSITPDIIAQKDDDIFIVEAKARFYQGDIDKLENINEGHIRDLKNKLNLSNVWFDKRQECLHKAICIGATKKEIEGLSIPNHVFVFAYSSGRIVVYKAGEIVNQI